MYKNLCHEINNFGSIFLAQIILYIKILKKGIMQYNYMTRELDSVSMSNALI